MALFCPIPLRLPPPLVSRTPTPRGPCQSSRPPAERPRQPRKSVHLQAQVRKLTFNVPSFHALLSTAQIELQVSGLPFFILKLCQLSVFLISKAPIILGIRFYSVPSSLAWLILFFTRSAISGHRIFVKAFNRSCNLRKIKKKTCKKKIHGKVYTATNTCMYVYIHCNTWFPNTVFPSARLFIVLSSFMISIRKKKGKLD